MTRICPGCGKEVGDGVHFCRNCGTPITEQQEELICPNCGNPLKPGMTYCTSCGADLKLPEPEPPVRKEPKPESVCPVCGGEVTPGTRFCRKCGTPLIKEPKPVRTEPKPEPEPPVWNDPPAEEPDPQLDVKPEKEKTDKSKIIIGVLAAVVLLLGILLAATLLKKGTESTVPVSPMQETSETTPDPSENTPEKENRIDLTDAMNDINTLHRILNGTAYAETGMHDNWYEDAENDLFGYGNYPGNTTVDDFWLASDQYSLYGIWVSEDWDTALSELLQQMWAIQTADGEYKVFTMEDVTLGISVRNEKVALISFMRDYRDADPEPQVTVRTGTIYISANANPRRIKIRKSPGLNGIDTGDRLYNGDRVTVYEETWKDNYTWYRIGNNRWFADNGKTFGIHFD